MRQFAVPAQAPTPRLTETRLLLSVAALVLVGFATVALSLERPFVGRPLFIASGFIAIALLLNATLSLRGFRGDQILLPLALGLTGLGLVVIYRVTVGRDVEALAGLQLVWCLVAAAAFLAPLLFMRDLSVLARYRYTWMAAGLGLLFVTAAFGEDVGGARISLRLGPVSFMPWELVKIVLVVFLAAYLDEYREVLTSARRGLWRHLPPVRYLVPIVAMWAAAMFVLVFQRDLGAALLFFGIFLAMLYVATGRVSYIVLGLAMLAAGAAVAQRLFAHVRVRVDMWLDPWAEPLGGGYQILGGLFSLGHGGLLGAGLGAGAPQMIPVVWSDFVFAAFAEETGFLGAVALLALYLVILYRGFTIAVGAPTTFLQLLAAGLTFVIGFQALMIVAGNAKLVPLTGITLPFVAYGGSSLVTNFLSIGLLLRISAEGARRAARSAERAG